jgi:integrase
MGVKVRKRGAKWCVVVDYRGRRKSKCVGSREAAELVRRQVEAKLALGDLSVLDAAEDKKPTFNAYADGWLKDYARIECKTSTADGYEGVLNQYLRPRFGKKLLNEIRRDDIKSLINQLISQQLSRNTIRNALCVIRGLFNYAIEEGLIESNPGARLGRFTRLAKTTETKGIALTAKEVQQFLLAAKEIRPYYHSLFLTAVRAGLRRGELVALQWGDLQLRGDDIDSDRFILVQHNYVRREHTTTKSKKSRRVDLSRELRRVLVELRDNVCWKLTLRARTTSPTSLSSRLPRARFSILTTSTIEFSCRCWPRQASARSAFTIYATPSGRFSCKTELRLST